MSYIVSIFIYVKLELYCKSDIFIFQIYGFIIKFCRISPWLVSVILLLSPEAERSAERYSKSIWLDLLQIITNYHIKPHLPAHQLQAIITPSNQKEESRHPEVIEDILLIYLSSGCKPLSNISKTCSICPCGWKSIQLLTMQEELWTLVAVIYKNQYPYWMPCGNNRTQQSAMIYVDVWTIASCLVISSTVSEH